VDPSEAVYQPVKFGAARTGAAGRAWFGVGGVVGGDVTAVVEVVVVPSTTSKLRSL
jgi:hypothetical protein